MIARVRPGRLVVAILCRVCGGRPSAHNSAALYRLSPVLRRGPRTARLLRREMMGQRDRESIVVGGRT